MLNSPDGLGWKSQISIPDMCAYSGRLSYGGGNWFVDAFRNNRFISNNGLDWEIAGQGASLNNLADVYYGGEHLAFGDGLSLAIERDKLWVSSDKWDSWQLETLPTDGAPEFESIVFTNGRWFVCGKNGSKPFILVGETEGRLYWRNDHGALKLFWLKSEQQNQLQCAPSVAGPWMDAAVTVASNDRYWGNARSSSARAAVTTGWKWLISAINAWFFS
jgi:hypothetical protein